jgi:SAM-dependent methyltransferase
VSPVSRPISTEGPCRHSLPCHCSAQCSPSDSPFSEGATSAPDRARAPSTTPSDPRAQPFPHLEALRCAYDGAASQRNGTADLQWRGPVLETWLRELPGAPRLLELGPGTGQLAAFAQELGARVHAIELSPANVGYCRQRGISAEVGDFRVLDHLEGLGRFDGVYSINALLHVPRAQHAAVIAGARQCLVPGGSLLLVNWGGRDVEGILEEDGCTPARFFSHHDDAGFLALEFEGFEVVRRELLSVQAPNGLHPQLLVLRSVSIGADSRS